MALDAALFGPQLLSVKKRAGVSYPVTLHSDTPKASEAFDQLCEVYACHDYRHASAVLIHDYPSLFLEVCSVLLDFRFSVTDIMTRGGNKGPIVKRLDMAFRAKGWKEQQLRAKLVVDEDVISVDTHRIDYVKQGVAFDLEWNSKDQTFDRDLNAFRAFFEYQRISAAIIVTRDNSLDPTFRQLDVYSKYGASTTHMGKLLPRITAGRSGGCPVLAIGITGKQYTNV